MASDPLSISMRRRGISIAFNGCERQLRIKDMKFARVAVWIFFLAISVLGIVFAIYELNHIGGPGPGGPGEGEAILVVLFILVLCGLVLIACFTLRPRASVLSPSRVLGSVLMFATIAAGWFWITHSIGRYKFSIRLLDQANEPVRDASVAFATYGGTGGIGDFDSRPRGEARTDSNGIFTIRLNHSYSVNMTIKKLGFKAGYLTLEESFRGAPHQITVDGMRFVAPANATSEAPREGAAEPRYWHVPASSSMSFTGLLGSNVVSMPKPNK